MKIRFIQQIYSMCGVIWVSVYIQVDWQLPFLDSDFHKTIHGIKIKKATATDRLQVDELASGLYLIKVDQNGQQSFQRIIVE